MHSFGTRACVCEILCGQHLRNFENNYYGCRFAMRDHMLNHNCLPKSVSQIFREHDGNEEALPSRIWSSKIILPG